MTRERRIATGPLPVQSLPVGKESLGGPPETPKSHRLAAAFGTRVPIRDPAPENGAGFHLHQGPAAEDQASRGVSVNLPGVP